MTGRNVLRGAVLRWSTLTIAVVVVVLYIATRQGQLPLPVRLSGEGGVERVRVLDRESLPLSVTYENQWNLHAQVKLYEVPEFLQQAFLLAEDRGFYRHSGVDWSARGAAVLQNIASLRVVRGASTISEQVIRMLHPRSRTLWSRWIEGFEAEQLERRFSKTEIFEFYLNQVPFSSRRRGIVEAAWMYFDRDLSTLSKREMLALAVAVRAPGLFDPRKPSQSYERRIELLARELQAAGSITEAEVRDLFKGDWDIRKQSLVVAAPHFVRQVRKALGDTKLPAAGVVRSTLDARLQATFQKLLDQRVHDLNPYQVSDGALLVIDHQTDEVLAWVNAGSFQGSRGGQIDMVVTPRQPGSTLKPFVYSLAMERGWTAATVILDKPLSSAVSTGLHDYDNYSHRFYGPIRLREALGNSLNIPAVRAALHVGRMPLLRRLRSLGFQSLNKPADFYGEGLALGNGEVSLYNLVSAYAVIARHGEKRPLRLLRDLDVEQVTAEQIVPVEISDLIGHILSDPGARRLEFGSGGLLRFPLQTAVKTGTSTDFRDAWSVGFNYRYTAGVWLGNLGQEPMDGISGAKGPLLVLRSVFNELSKRDVDTEPLRLSSKLQKFDICAHTGKRAGRDCPHVSEWFVPGSEPLETCHSFHHTNGDESRQGEPRLVLPTWNLRIARDPRTPDNLERFAFEIAGSEIMRAEWYVDDVLMGTTAKDETRFLWPLEAGPHKVHVLVWTALADQPVQTETVPFSVR